jgi:dipeptidyl aminopeptidase/acylaminoacyl peptidase
MSPKSIDQRYVDAASLWPWNLTSKVVNGRLSHVWVDDTHVGYGGVVVDVVTGQRRAATEADGVPPVEPPAPGVEEGEPPAALLSSPDGTWSIGQEDGNLTIVVDGEVVHRTVDGSPLDGYGVYYGNWKAGHIPRSRYDGPVPPFEAHWAPDSSRVIVPRVDQRHVAPYPFLETAPLDGSFRPVVHAPRFPLSGEAPVRLTWYAFDRTGRSVLLDLPDDLLFLHQDLTALRTVSFSSDGSRAFVVVHGHNMRSGHLLEVDLGSGACRTVLTETRHPRMELNVSSYRRPNVFVIGDLEKVVWFSQRDGWGHLYLYDGDGRLLNRITSGDWTVRDVLRCTDEWIYFTGSGRDLSNPYLRSLYRVRYDGTGLTLLSPEDADCELDPSGGLVLGIKASSDVLSPGEDYVVYRCSTVSTPPVTVVRSTVDGSLLQVLETADVSALAGYRPPEEFVTKAADGSTDLYGVMYLPADFDPTRSYPIVVQQYASPLMAATPRNYLDALRGAPGVASAAALAALGTAVVTVDARGTTGREAAFAEHGFGALNIIGLDDYVAAIEQLGARHSWLDTSRVAISGGSYGGYTTLRAMIEFPEVFSVGLSYAPMAVPHLMYPDYHWEAYHGEPSYGGSNRRPVQTALPDNWDAVNAVAQVDRVQGHLLVAVGELDENCPPGNIMPFIRAAIELDKNVELLYVPGASHQTLMRSRYVNRRHVDFLTRHLLGETPPERPDWSAIHQSPEPAIRKTPSPW